LLPITFYPILYFSMAYVDLDKVINVTTGGGGVYPGDIPYPILWYELWLFAAKDVSVSSDWNFWLMKSTNEAIISSNITYRSVMNGLSSLSESTTVKSFDFSTNIKSITGGRIKLQAGVDWFATWSYDTTAIVCDKTATATIIWGNAVASDANYVYSIESTYIRKTSKTTWRVEYYWALWVANNDIIEHAWFVYIVDANAAAPRVYRFDPATDWVTSVTIPWAIAPQAICWDATYLYVTVWTNMYRISIATFTVFGWTLALGASNFACARESAWFVYALSTANSRIVKVDTSTFTSPWFLATGTSPNSMAISAWFAYVVSPGTNTVIKVDLSTFTNVWSLAVPAWSTNIAISAWFAYISCATWDTIEKIDLTSFTIVDSLSIIVQAGKFNSTISWSEYYFQRATSEIWIIDLTAFTVVSLGNYDCVFVSDETSGKTLITIIPSWAMAKKDKDVSYNFTPTQAPTSKEILCWSTSEWYVFATCSHLASLGNVLMWFIVTLPWNSSVPVQITATGSNTVCRVYWIKEDNDFLYISFIKTAGASTYYYYKINKVSWDYIMGNVANAWYSAADFVNTTAVVSSASTLSYTVGAYEYTKNATSMFCYPTGVVDWYAAPYSVAVNSTVIWSGVASVSIWATAALTSFEEEIIMNIPSITLWSTTYVTATLSSAEPLPYTLKLIWQPTLGASYYSTTDTSIFVELQ